MNQDSPEAVWGVQWRHLFGTRTFAEVKYSGWWGYYYLDPALNSPASYDLTQGTWSGGGLYNYYADRKRNQVNASISHYADAFGKHDLKFGVEIERSSVHSQFGYTGGLYYYDYTEYYPKGQYLAYDYGYDSEGRNGRESLYAQDSWKPTDRLTINAGVRVDFVRGRSPVLDKTVYSNTNWAPRIGFAFDATGDGKTVIRGHYGQYYEAMLYDQYARAMPGFTDFVGYSYDPEGKKCGPLGNCFSESSRLLYPVYGVDPNMKQPRVDEWTAGLERALTNDLRFSVTGMWRQDKNVQGSVYPDARWTASDGHQRPHRPAPDRLPVGEPGGVPDDAAADQPRRLRLPRRGRQRSRHRAGRAEVPGGDGGPGQAVHQPLAGPRLVRVVEGRQLFQQHGLEHLRAVEHLGDPDQRAGEQRRPARSTTGRTR